MFFSIMKSLRDGAEKGNLIF